MIVYIQQIRVAGWIRVVLSWYCYTWVRTDNYNKLEEEKKLALFMKRIINFQQMIRCKGVLFRKDWRIINQLLVSGLLEDGQG